MYNRHQGEPSGCRPVHFDLIHKVATRFLNTRKKRKVSKFRLYLVVLTLESTFLSGGQLLASCLHPRSCAILSFPNVKGHDGPFFFFFSNEKYELIHKYKPELDDSDGECD